MERHHGTRWIAVSCLALLLVAFPSVLHARIMGQSDLSRWLSNEVTPQISDLLTRHPRFEKQVLHVETETNNDLEEALVTTLAASLAGRDGILLDAGYHVLAQSNALPARIDDLDCGAVDQHGVQLRVSVTKKDTRQGLVLITLSEVANLDQTPHRWQWYGTFTASERNAFIGKPAINSADGSLSAPWGEQDIESAAFGLHRQLACALRPQIRTRLELGWPEARRLPHLFADTANRSRHLLGNYMEIGLTADEPDFVMDLELTPFQEDTWQLWLTAVPQKSELAPVQAIAYFKTSARVEIVDQTSRVETIPAALLPEKNRGPALDYLFVELLDATQLESGFSTADLQVQLRLQNRSQWPIEYAFSFSGGHYQHCVPEPAYYRHDRYGYLEGRLVPGQSLVRRVVIEGAQHRPKPWFGIRKCAGFRSLQGFEDFTRKGHTVTEYIRWSM